MDEISAKNLSKELLKQGCILPEGMGIETPFSFEAPVSVSNGIGANVNIGAFSYTCSALFNCQIGRYCSIAPNVEILGNHPTTWLTTHPFTHVKDIFADLRNYLENKENSSPPPPPINKKLISFNRYPTSVIIGNDVWIGSGVKICDNLKIGTGAIIAAGAVVTKDVPPYALVGGIPAKIIKYRFDESVCKILLKSRWWRYDITRLELNFQNPLEAVKQIKLLTKNKKLDIWNPGWKTIQ